jgi:uncharacterized membrane protein
MNLWIIFPEFLLQINGILYLPYFAVPFYIYVLYALVKHPKYRAQLSIFLTMTCIASSLMIFTLGPRIGTIIAPLTLLSVMVMPLCLFIYHMIKNIPIGKYVWGFTTLAGWLHSISWAVWLFALAGS